MEKKDFLEKYCSTMTDQQTAAVVSVNGPTLLLAVPGSGKTTVLVRRLGYMVMVEGISPSNILTVTYTVAATKDMKSRYASVFGEGQAEALEFRTINGICSKIISYASRLYGKNSFALLSDERARMQMLSQIWQKYEPEFPTDSDLKNLSTLITYSKNMMLEQKQIEALGADSGIHLKEMLKEYKDCLRSQSLMDYDDQMVYALKLLKQPVILNAVQKKYRYILVDEAQDTSKIQHEIIKVLASKDKNIFMVGDEDQSIYGFRAAYPEALINFEKNYENAAVLLMTKNFRSDDAIVDCAAMFIKKNKYRHPKDMVSSHERKNEVFFTSVRSRVDQFRAVYEALARPSDSGTIAVLYRDNESVVPLVDHCERHGIPYKLRQADLSFFTSRVITDICNLLRFALDPYNEELFMQLYYKLGIFLNKYDATSCVNMAKSKKIPMLAALKLKLSGVHFKKTIVQEVESAMKDIRDGKVTPKQAVSLVMGPVGYYDYCRKSHLKTDCVTVLSMIAENEKTVPGLLQRLNDLRDIIRGHDNHTDGVLFSTIHSSKGLEYDHVYLIDVIDKIFPAKTPAELDFSNMEDVKAYEEERRLYYVGITRAKQKLYLFNVSNDSYFNKEVKKNIEAKKKEEEIRKRAEVLLKAEEIDHYRFGKGVIKEISGARMTVVFDNRERKFDVERILCLMENDLVEVSKAKE